MNTSTSNWNTKVQVLPQKTFDFYKEESKTTSNCPPFSRTELGLMRDLKCIWERLEEMKGVRIEYIERDCEKLLFHTEPWEVE